MTALAADRSTPRRGGESYSYPVAASVTCYAGGIAVLDTAGNCKPGVAGVGLIAVGRFAEQVANGSTAAAVNVIVEPGCFRFTNSGSTDAITKADIGRNCYIVDDQTVARTSGSNARSVAGVVVDVDALGVWVHIGTDKRQRIPVSMGALSNKATDAAVLRWVSPVYGTLDAIYAVLNAALATGDATLTAAINGTAVTGGVVTVTQSGSAAGDVDSAFPTAANVVSPGDVVTITGGGASTATSTNNLTLLITPRI